jgi:UPF0042 nucleotide-binding protein
LNSENNFPVLILTGLSGAGKSTALHVFEDLGFFCVDGLPSNMVTRLVQLFQEENPRNYRGMALGMDIRQPTFLQEWHRTLQVLQSQDIHPQVIFLEAGLDALLDRYATTRRPHPLESREMGLKRALETEMELLEPLRNEAELVINTTGFSIHDLRRHLQEEYDFLSDISQGMRVHIISFGFKYGVPKEADLVFDLRFMPNPYFEEDLQTLSGRDQQVRDYVLGSEPGRTFHHRFTDFLFYLLPLYANEGRYRMTLALGCTGGRHRSVAVAEALHTSLKQNHYKLSLEHRHLELG